MHVRYLPAHAAFICASLLSACVAHTSAHQSGTIPAQELLGLPVEDGLYPGERVVRRGGDDERRDGVTPSGFKYLIYSDGTGTIQSNPAASPLESIADSWSIECKRDAMTDRRNCHAKQIQARLFIYYGDSSTPANVCILGHDFPGRSGAIRVDSGAAISTNNEGCVAASRIFGQLTSGKRVTVRYYKWPYDYSRDHNHVLVGINDAHAMIGHIRKTGAGR